MKVLTIHQPYASLLVLNIKDVENRSWSTQHRGKLGIHAGLQRVSADAFRAVFELMDLGELHRLWAHLGLPIGQRITQEDFPRGVLLGHVELHSVSDGASSAWAIPGNFHWRVRRGVALGKRVACSGKQGLWNADDSYFSGA